MKQEVALYFGKLCVIINVVTLSHNQSYASRTPLVYTKGKEI